jgi:hypothetical protein
VFSPAFLPHHKFTSALSDAAPTESHACEIKIKRKQQISI